MTIEMGWREEHLLEMLRKAPMRTAAIVKKANMAKATALKYLEGLKGRGLVDCEMIGPTKIWRGTNFCEECKEKMVRYEIYVCPQCGKKGHLTNLENKHMNHDETGGE